jgi:hypothetical protein
MDEREDNVHIKGHFFSNVNQSEPNRQYLAWAASRHRHNWSEGYTPSLAIYITIHVIQIRLKRSPDEIQMKLRRVSPISGEHKGQGTHNLKLAWVI